MGELKLSDVAKKLNLSEVGLRGVFVLGSRLWGTARRDSDWDLLVVHADVTGKTSRHSGDGRIDAVVTSQEEYFERCRRHQWLECLTLFVPPDNCLRKQAPPADFTIDRRLLAASVAEETNKDWARARKYVERGDLERAKRTIVHTLRMNMMALQLATHGRIVDFTVANDLREELWGVYSQDWRYYDVEYGGRLRGIKAELDYIPQPVNAG